MNELDEIHIDNLIYEMRGRQVMLDSDDVVTKWHDYLVDKIITHWYW